MNKIMIELETAGEISSLVKETIKKETNKLDKIKQSIEELENDIEDLENENSELETNKTELEKTIKDLEHNLELKQSEITSKIQFEQDKHDSYIASLENILTEKKIELVDIQNTLDSVFQNGYENEFDFTECDYIIKEPFIHLNVDKALKSIYGITTDNLYFVSNYSYYNHEYNKLLKQNNYNYNINYCIRKQEEIHNLNFPIIIKLNTLEFIVKVYLINLNKNNIRDYASSGIFNNISSELEKTYMFIYLTNFGRFIASEINCFKSVFGQTTCGISHNDYCFKMLKNNINCINCNEFLWLVTTIKNINDYNGNHGFDQIVLSKNLIEEIPPPTILPKLNYRMPRLFLDVIDAFHTQNNDLMQECCKKYLTITRSKGNEQQIIDNIEFDRIIRNKDNFIEEQNKLIKERNITIGEQNSEIEKLKLEITKLKSALAVFAS
jgi:predicted XRE-type DNA-binding protein